jgi:hypothetical protein
MVAIMTSFLPQWRHRHGNGRVASRGCFVADSSGGAMDIHHKDPGLVWDEWDSIFETGLNVDAFVLDCETKVVVEFVRV